MTSTPKHGEADTQPLHPVALVAAMSLNRVIGRDGKLPWRLSSDLKRFKAATLGKPMIMGRKTYEGIGRPLPGRTTILISSTFPHSHPGLIRVHSFFEALHMADAVVKRRGGGEIIVAGGASVYEEALPVASRLLLTVVDTNSEGDVFFPTFDLGQWREHSREHFPAGPEDEFATTVFDYRRSTPD